MDSQAKKQITEVWLNAFPQLRPYSQDKLYKIIGCFVVGLELIKLPRIDNYRPHLAWYPLYKNKVDDCLKSPLLHDQFYHAKGNQLNLPYVDRTERYKEAQNAVDGSLKINLNNSVVKLKDITHLTDYFLHHRTDQIYKVHSGKRAKIYELKFYAVLSAGDLQACEDIVQEIKLESRNWDLSGFDLWHGPFENWLSNLENMPRNRTSFINQIQGNINDKKISKLTRAEIVN